MNFLEQALEAGFTASQAEFLLDHVAKMPHTHEPDEIVGLDDYIAQQIDEGDEDDDDDEDDDTEG